MIGPDDIDALLAADKRVVGHPEWENSRETTVRLKAPLQIRDEIIGRLFLLATASIHQVPQHGSLVLAYLDRPIQRLDVFPLRPHVNPSKNVPKALRGQLLAAGGHQFHRWSNNRRWPRAPNDNLPVAERVDVSLDSYEAAVAFFFEQTNIRGGIPAPPHEPRLRL